MKDPNTDHSFELSKIDIFDCKNNASVAYFIRSNDLSPVDIQKASRHPSALVRAALFENEKVIITDALIEMALSERTESVIQAMLKRNDLHLSENHMMNLLHHKNPDIRVLAASKKGCYELTDRIIKAGIYNSSHEVCLLMIQYGVELKTEDIDHILKQGNKSNILELIKRKDVSLSDQHQFILLLDFESEVRQSARIRFSDWQPLNATQVETGCLSSTSGVKDIFFPYLIEFQNEDLLIKLINHPFQDTRNRVFKMYLDGHLKFTHKIMEILNKGSYKPKYLDEVNKKFIADGISDMAASDQYESQAAPRSPRI